MKDELVKEDQLDVFSEYVEITVRIDNRLYERKIKRKGKVSDRPWNKDARRLNINKAR